MNFYFPTSEELKSNPAWSLWKVDQKFLLKVLDSTYNYDCTEKELFRKWRTLPVTIDDVSQFARDLSP